MAMFFDPYGSSGTSAFGGGSVTPSLYGGLLDDTQQEALRQRGLMGFLGGMQKAGSLDYVDPFSGVRIGGLAAGLAGGAQGMLNAQDQGVLNALNAQKLGLEGQQLQFKVGGVKALMPALQKLIDQMGGAPAGSPDVSGPQTAGPGGVEPSGGIGTAPAVSSQTADTTLPPEARALLDSISGPESQGAYNARWPSKTFDSFDQHPRIFEPGPEGPSSAAGRYQITASTYDEVAPKAGVTDFSPVSQDQLAWNLANDTYQKNTGRDLLADLRAGDTGRVASALQGRWATLGRGIKSYDANLAKYAGDNTGSSELAAIPDYASRMSAPLQAGADSQPGKPDLTLPTPGPIVLDVNDLRQRLIAQNGPSIAAPIRLAQNGPPTALAPAMPQAQPPMARGLPQTASGIDPRALALAGTGAMAGLYGLGDVVKPLENAFYNSPQQKGAVAGAEAFAKAPYEDAYLKAALAARLLPPGSPEQQLAQAHLSNLAGIKPILGGERPGVPIRKYNQATGQYDIVDYNPRVGEGQIFNGNEVQVIPKAAEAEQTMATARAAGPAAFKQENIHGPYGQGFTTTALNLANALGAGGGTTAPTSVGGGMATGLNVAPSAQPQAPGLSPGGAIAPAPALRPEAAPPTFPVRLPDGNTKDLSSLSVTDLFPNGQGIPQPPKPPPGATYGPASASMTELQKKDADRVEQYGMESAQNQKGYQDLAHLREILDRGMRTSNIAPLWKDLGNLAQGLGIPLKTPVDVNDAAAFDKAATDLTYAAVKKMGGRVLVSEIEGLQKANPNLVIPRAANYSLLNDIVSYSKWQDTRAKLAQDYLTETGGAPLSAFESRFNTVAPLDAVTQHYKSIFRSLGATFPGDQEGAGRTYAIGPNGHMIYRQNGALFDAATGKAFNPGQ